MVGGTPNCCSIAVSVVAILVEQLAAFGGEAVESSALSDSPPGSARIPPARPTAAPAGPAKRDRAATNRARARASPYRTSRATRRAPAPAATAIAARPGTPHRRMQRGCRSSRRAGRRQRARQRASSHRHDEQAREAQQHLAVVARLIGADDFLGIGGEKFFAVGGIERRQETAAATSP